MTSSTFCREAGSGPGVVCLHSNASSSSQWRALTERLAPAFHVLAPDGYGAGKGPPWPAERPLTLRDEAALLEPVFERAGPPFALVGHSYGAAVALVAAVQQPRRVRALLLYEPTLFSLVDAERPPPNEVDGIRRAVQQAVAAVTSGDPGSAGEHFIDYWMGSGSWRTRSEAQRCAIEATIANVQAWGRAVFEEPTSLQAFAALRMPVLLMVGKQTQPSARAVARQLVTALPQLELVEFEDIGHMGPITHPEPINAVVEDFLRRHPAG